MDGLIVLYGIVVLVGAIGPIVMIATAKTPLERGPYALRTILGFIATIVVVIVSSVAAGSGGTPEAGVMAGVIGSLVGTLYSLALARWVASRYLDMGSNRWWAMLLYVPIANLVVIIMLFFMRSAPARQGTADVFN